MIAGSCLCGGVRFEMTRVVGPFELCHCRRCRKATGSAFAAAVGVRTADFRLLQGKELIATYEAPLLEHPPPYSVSFCSRCGSLVPNPHPESTWFEVSAGLLDGDPGLRHVVLSEGPRGSGGWVTPIQAHIEAGAKKDWRVVWEADQDYPQAASTPAGP